MSKYSYRNVIMFIALHTRFSTEDLDGYDDMKIYRLLVGISKDTKSEEIRVWAEEALAHRDEWSQWRKK